MSWRVYARCRLSLVGVCAIRVVIVCAAVTLLTRELRIVLLLLSVLSLRMLTLWNALVLLWTRALQRALVLMWAQTMRRSLVLLGS